MKHLIVCLLLLLCGYQGKSQCPTAGFSIPDSICAGSNLTITNSTIAQGPVTYAYDFCAGDLDKTPTVSLTGNFSSTMADPLGADVVFDGTDYYMFVCNLGSSSITRVDFGNSLSNIPTSTNLGTLGGFLGGCADVKIQEANGQWYGFVSCNNGNFIRVDFGASLQNPAPAAVLINSNGLTSGTYYMNFYSIDNHYYALLANTGNNGFVTYDFGTDILNINPTVVFTAAPDGAVSGSIVKICNNLSVFTVSISAGTITRFDYGSSFSNVPTVTSLTLNIGIQASREIEVVNDNGKWYGFVGSSPGDNLTMVEFGSNIYNNSPNLKILTGVFTSADYAFCIRKSGSEWNGFAVSLTTKDIYRFAFPNDCHSSISTSTSATPPAISLTGEGYHYFSLTVRDSSGEYLYNDSIYVNPVPQLGFSISSACQGSSVQFTDTSTISSGNIVSSTWDFGDTQQANGISVQHTYSTTNTYNIIHTVTSNKACSVSAQQVLIVHEVPTADFSFIDNQCSYSNVSFNDLSQSNDGILNSWHWSFGDDSTSVNSSPIHPYAPGAYTVQLIVAANTGCVDTISKNINIVPGPKSLFAIYNTCTGEQTSFINSSIVPTGLTVQYNWDFGDTNTSTATDPFNNYAATAANYNVQLISTSSNGCKDTLLKNIHIGSRPNPVFKFAPDTVCAGTAAAFTDSSYVSAGESIINRFWDFGDNTYDSTHVNPTHIYQTAGTYTVKLTVLSPTYCDSVITHNVFVIESPVAAFTTSNVCKGLLTPFNDQSTAPAGSSITSWTWSFGDNDSAFVNDTSHLYINSGIYNASLTVVTSTGCSGKLTKAVNVYSLPKVNFTVSKACTSTPVQFTDSTYVDGLSASSWSWNFGDNSSLDTNQNPQHIFITSALYPITLIATSSNGCVDSINKFTIVDQSPNFNILVSDTCYRLANKFQFKPIGSVSTQLDYLWTFGDATAATLANPSHVYASAGTYPVSLIVTDRNNHCSITKLDTASVFSLPIANFTRDSSCVNQALHLNDQSSGTIAAWNWNFASHGNSQSQNPILTLAVADSFNVKLVITSDNGCKDSITQYARVYPLPLVNFTPSVSYGGPPLPVDFINNSNASTYTWNFGDNSGPDNSINPQHIYADTGLYKIVLIAASNNGCIDSASDYVSVLIPVLDLALEAVSFSQVNNLWQIKARVRNRGNVDITSFELNSKLDGKSLVNELWNSDTIFAGQSFEYTLATRFQIDDNNDPGYLCVSLLKANNVVDDNTSNNERCVTAGKEFGVFELYPNPFNESMNLGINMTEAGVVEIQLVNLTGQEIQKAERITLTKGYNNISYSKPELSKGVYLLSISYKDLKIMRKVIKY